METWGYSWKSTAHIPPGTRYRRLADSGPAGELQGPARVDVVTDFKYGADWKGTPRLTTTTATLELIDGTYRMTRFEATGAKDAWLDFEEVRGIPVAETIHTALAVKIKLRDANGRTYSAKRPIPNPDPLWEVALHYSVARAFRANPTSEVARILDISRDAAAQRVYRARDKGYLPPTDPGKAS